MKLLLPKKINFQLILIIFSLFICDRLSGDNIKLIELYPHHIYELDSYLHEQIKSFTENKNSNWLVKNMFPKKKKENEKKVSKKPFIDNVPLPDKSSKSSICNFCNFSNTGNTNYCEECGNKIQS